MSKEIICPNCQASNTPGSKFCNNCGNRLPPSTSLICPNCNTPNPRDRFYCDNCGSRLIKDSPASRGPEPEEGKPLPQTGTFFSLPARPPGQTGELDPLQIVPDWLKKQAEAPQEEEDEEDLRLRMPKIEEVGPSKKVTDDLPDWLVDEHDSDPIIGSPRIITTEHFMNLVQPPETTDEAKDLTEAADKAELPDWLTDLASPATGDKAVHSDDLSTPDDALNEWLSSISGDQQDEPPSDVDDLEAQLAGLSESKELDADREEEPSDEFSTDWLNQAALESPDVDSLSGLETEDQALGDEMFDWMTENLVDSGMLDPSVVADSEPESDDDIGSDWLTDFANAADEEPLSDAVGEESLDAMGGRLDVDEFDETDANKLVDLTDAIAQQDMDTADGDLPGWISEIAGQDEAEEGKTVPAPGSQPGWMAEFATADSEAFAQELESKLEALDAKEDDEFAVELPDETQLPPSTDDEWLDDFAAFDEGETAVPDETPEPVEEQLTESEPLPDWLSDLGGETLVSEPDDSGDIFTDLFASPEADSGIPDWIGDEAPEAEAMESSPADDTETEQDTVLAETDWLSEMVAMGDEAFAVDETAEEEATETAVSEQPESAVEEPEQPSPDLFAADWPEEEEVEEEELAPAKSDVLPSDWGTADSLLVDALDEELPDWLDELGAPPSADEAAQEPDMPVIPSESMPDWIAQMKPGSSFRSGGLAETSELPDLADSYSDLPAELVGPGLPDWLQDADEIAAQPVAPLEESADIPEWLAESIPSESGFAGAADQPSEDDQEWTAVFQDLPPNIPVAERLAKAEIPDWVLALQPESLGEEDVASTEAEALPLEGGPLAGIRGVIEIEPVMAEARPVSAVPSFATSPEQISQATLLRQLALAEKSTAKSVRETDTSSSGIVRLLLAGLLMAAILLGLVRPNLLQPTSVAAPAHLAAAYMAVENAAGAPVLVAVDYTPALSGELDAQTEMLLAQLAANGSSVVTVSQSAAGTAVIQRLAADYPTLGLLPGQSIGLRQLGDCLAGDVACKTLSGRALTGTMPQSLNDVALIIVLTGERDNLVNWLEQVAISGDIPMVAGVTKSLTPVALPYLDSAQLQGMIGGLPETAVYQQELLNQPPDETIMRQLSAQTLAQLLAAVLLLVGGATFGVINLVKRGEK